MTENSISRKRANDARRARRPKMASMEEIDAMPALISIPELSSINGCTPIYNAAQCRNGMFKEIAVKCGREWRVNKQKALELLKLA